MSAPLWHSLFQAILDVIYPTRCVICERLKPQAICADCWAQILRCEPPLCRLCGVMLPLQARGMHLCGECRSKRRYFDGARAAGLHTATLRTAIIQFKFHNRRDLKTPLAQLLAECLEAELEPPDGLPLKNVDCLVPVPLHPRRRQWRGFDQALLLTEELSRLTGLAVVEGLQRIKQTIPQPQLTPEEREENMRNAFAPVGEVLAQKRVLLIDDVFTTGATMNEAARAAKRGGAAFVYALTVSRPPPPWHPAALTLEPGDI